MRSLSLYWPVPKAGILVIVATVKLIVTLAFEFLSNDFKQDAMVIPVDLWIELFKHLNCALRWLLSRQLQPILIQMIVPEILDELPLVPSQRVGRHELQDTTRLDEAENVNFSRQALGCLLVHLNALFSL